MILHNMKAQSVCYFENQSLFKNHSTREAGPDNEQIALNTSLSGK